MAQDVRRMWKDTYRFIRMEGVGFPWKEYMRPFKAAALAAYKCRTQTGQNRRLIVADEMDGYRRRYDALVLDLADRRLAIEDLNREFSYADICFPCSEMQYFEERRIPPRREENGPYTPVNWRLLLGLDNPLMDWL